MSTSTLSAPLTAAPATTAPLTRPSLGRPIGMTLYILFLFVPIYWLLNISFKTNGDILGALSLWPQHPTLDNYRRIFADAEWHASFVNSILYVGINTIISVTVALPAAYAFSRYRFVGDKPLFFWLLSNLMAPPAVYAMPFFNLYQATGLFDTIWAVALAHCLFNVPLAVWILEGFISGVPREIDETAMIDGYSFPRFFVKIFLPLIANGIGGRGFLLLHVLLGGAAAGHNPDDGGRQAYRRDDVACLFGGRPRLGASVGCRGAHDDPGRDRHLVRAQPYREGLRPGPGLRRLTWTGSRTISPGWPGRGRRWSSSSPSRAALPC